jgi:hypothetical protein
MAASLGPMMKPTPRKAGEISGPRRRSEPLPGEMIFCHFAARNLSSVRTVNRAPKPIPARRCPAPFAPAWPALWMEAAATDSGKGRSFSPMRTRRVIVTNMMPRIPPAARMAVAVR